MIIIEFTKNLIYMIRIYLVRWVLRLFYIFPVVKNRIVFVSYGGSQFSCSPKYIYEFLSKRYGDKFQYVWMINNSSILPNLPKNIEVIRRRTLKYYYYLLTAKIIITNNGKNRNLPIRKEVCFIETWHGGGAYKRVGFNIIRKNKPFFVISQIMRTENISFYSSSCKKFSEMFSSSFPIPKSKALECGMPRNDMFFGDYSGITSKVREYYNISDDKKIVLYAPTFRGSTDPKKASFEVLKENEIDIRRCLEALKKQFSGEFIFLFRMHHYISSNTLKGCINVTGYPDMQELLCAADVLITDYSSSIWDFSMTGKPCFLYTPDVDEYDRGFYTPIEEWPGILSRDNESLVENIESFDEAAFAQRVKRHHESMGSYETGRASQIVGEKIYEICFGSETR